MFRKTDLLKRTDEIENYIGEQLLTCPADKLAATAAYYRTIIKNFREYIADYFANTTSKASNLHDIIFNLFQYNIMYSIYEVNKNIFATRELITSDLRELFQCADTFPNFMALPVEDFFEGFKDNTSSVQGYSHSQLLNNMQNGESSDILKRLEYINVSLLSITKKDQLILIFEELASGSADYSRDTIADRIYKEQGALDIITTYNLDVYVPTRFSNLV